MYSSRPCSELLAGSDRSLLWSGDTFVARLRVKVCIALYRKPIVELRSVTCHMVSHRFTCHPTQVNVPHLNQSTAFLQGANWNFSDLLVTNLCRAIKVGLRTVLSLRELIYIASVSRTAPEQPVEYGPIDPTWSKELLRIFTNFKNVKIGEF